MQWDKVGKELIKQCCTKEHRVPQRDGAHISLETNNHSPLGWEELESQDLNSGPVLPQGAGLRPSLALSGIPLV